MLKRLFFILFFVLFASPAFAQFSTIEVQILKSLTTRQCADGENPEWDTVTQRWSCGAGGGSSAFADLTTGTNTTAAMTVGTGGSLNTSGSGTIAATTATSLASNPTDCAAGAYANAIAASGNLSCEILIVSSASDPTVNDDTGDGYIIGTKWINTTDDSVFVAVDVTAAAAVWQQVYPQVTSEADTLETVMGRGNSTTKCTEAGPCRFSNAADTIAWLIYVNDANQPIIEPSSASDVQTRIMTNQTWCLYDVEGTSCMETVDPDGASPNAIWQYTTNYKPRKSVWFGAGSLSTDGTQCAAPAEVTINSGPKTWTIICTDNDASTIYGSVRMPDSWDGGTVTFTHVYIQTAADTGVLNGDIACQARSNGEVPSSTWGSEVALDDAAVVGSNSSDQTTSAAVTCAGTGLAGGDMLFFRYQLDATGTTTAVATLHHVGFNMEYTVNSRSD